MTLIGSKEIRRRRRHVVTHDYQSSRDRKSAPPHAVFGTGCQRVHLRDDTTTDPRLVTCAKCNKWLHGHVQYYNFLLTAAVKRGPATVPHEAASRFGEVGGSAMSDSVPAGPQLPLWDGPTPVCRHCGNEPASREELEERWTGESVLFVSKYGRSPSVWTCDRADCLEKMVEASA